MKPSASKTGHSQQMFRPTKNVTKNSANRTPPISAIDLNEEQKQLENEGEASAMVVA